ncbi:uncharacterized protein PgNI_12503 [Pyricularia grisea]|uniref:Uncharacterized protein n=1 Tax=Pyricularia grisea TaxID=148305 RepID=A0A6P8AM61_PYRGI|nr:uncharacterized protein PgNI_12503 [Pyricularia grisea]TLD03125.1 hypothetical protein PgNI_12503 [Pyricularia grisea]
MRTLTRQISASPTTFPADGFRLHGPPCLSGFVSAWLQRLNQFALKEDNRTYPANCFLLERSSAPIWASTASGILHQLAASLAWVNSCDKLYQRSVTVIKVTFPF